MPAREDMAHGAVRRPVEGGGQGAEEAAPGLALPANDRDLVEKGMAAPRCGRTATRTMGGMKGAPGLAGRVPPERGSLWSIRSRPLPPTRLAPPVGQPGRTVRRTRWCRARRGTARRA